VAHPHPLADQYGRQVRTLRVSLTEHCNFRCVYCMPPEGLPFLDTSHYLSIDEIACFVRVAATLGVSRVRLTGGEPLLRREVVEIVAAIKASASIDELSMTTNGTLLARRARELRDAGLDSLNVSLDSLDATRFAAITRASQYERVREGVAEARRVGFPVKLNVVVLAGMPDAEVLEFARLAFESAIDVRFLEFMPLCGSAWQPDAVYPIAKIRDIVAAHFELQELPRGDRPAQTFRMVGGRGRVGFIAPLSEPFCSQCSRMRLTADGKIRPCLFSNDAYSVRDLLRRRAADETLAEAIRRAVWQKPWGSEFGTDPFREGESTVRRVAGAPAIRTIGG
jgi:cyclic pyranopterin phosphate synthase